MEFFENLNPYTLQPGTKLPVLSAPELEDKIQAAKRASKEMKKWTLEQRLEAIRKIAEDLELNYKTYAIAITTEMGKPIGEAIKEVKKCATACRYYLQNAAEQLKPRAVKTEAWLTEIRYEPLGVILGIMPWNFPFWQAIRFAVPTLISGNAVLLKHAPNVPQCGLLLEKVFKNVGLPNQAYQNLIVSHKQIEKIIAHRVVKAVSLTGSTRAGSAVAALAGKHIKPTLLELGGSNSLLVLPDAPLEKALNMAINARFMNSGQSCISAKRIFVHESMYKSFTQELTARVKMLRFGDPLDENNHIGPLARRDLAENLVRQIKESQTQGARLLIGGIMEGCMVSPAVLADVKPGMPAFDEETFGPLACVIKYSTEKEMLKMANNSRYGLGTALVTSDIKAAEKLISRLEDGAVNINRWIHSDPRLPFGGVKNSGYGRELGKEGLLAFCNIKSVQIDK